MAASVILVDFMQMKVYYTEATNTGWKFPGTAVGNRAISGGVAWATPDNIKADDSSRADFVSGESPPDYDSLGLAATNFDFSSIPAGATIDGVEVRCEGYSGTTGLFTWTTLRLVLADDSDGSENKFADLAAPNGLQTDEAGGYNDLWSEGTITRADVQDSDFGFFVGLNDAMGDRTFGIDSMQMRVFYTEGEAGEEAALTTVLGTSAVDTLDKIITVDITGLDGTAAVGTLDKASLIALTGLVGTTAVDTLVALIGASEQEGFRWRNDDGTEITATWRQAQDVDEEVSKEENIRLRILIDTTGNLPTQQATLQYKRDDEADSEWRDI